MLSGFEWDADKDIINVKKHGVSFAYATQAFRDDQHLIKKDEKHSNLEERYFCFGKIGKRVLTVRFTYRNGMIRIFGAAYWRRGEREYAQR